MTQNGICKLLENKGKVQEKVMEICQQVGSIEHLQAKCYFMCQYFVEYFNLENAE